jgi:hypothetical protein
VVARADSIDSISKGLDAGGDQNRNSKFLNYFRGQQVPWRSLVDLADKVVPGSSWELRQVIWSALRMDISAREHAHAWMQQLVAPIQVVVMTHNNEIRLDSGRHLLPSLERRASFDALAALTILIRLAHEQGNREFVWQCAHSIMRVLLMIGMELFEYKIATRLFNLYVERIFPLASKRGMALSVKDFSIFTQCAFPAYAAEKLREETGSYRDRRIPSYYALEILRFSREEKTEPRLEPELGKKTEIDAQSCPPPSPSEVPALAAERQRRCLENQHGIKLKAEGATAHL